MKEMKPFRSLVSHSEALQMVLSTVKPIEASELVPIDSSVSRVLAQDVVAEMNVPPFSRAAMDGYAVVAEDTYGATQLEPVKLRVADVLNAGEASDRALQRGECIQIATGCPAPEGANAVVMVEFTEVVEGGVRVFRPVHPGANIAPEGEDAKKGERVLVEGDVLTPAKVGVLAALGREEICVYVQPTIAILPTGKEIVPVGKPLSRGQIFDVNSHTLQSVVSTNGGKAVQLSLVPDSLEEIISTIRQHANMDMIVVSGGSSVGQRDLLVDAIERLGEILFHGVQVSPGKPTLLGVVGGKPILGMPGYPASCLSNAYLYLVPALRRLARLPPKRAVEVKARLAQRVVSTLGRREFLTVRLDQGEAQPIFKRSGAITRMAMADGYIVVPENLDVLEKGEEVSVFLL